MLSGQAGCCHEVTRYPLVANPTIFAVIAATGFSAAIGFPSATLSMDVGKVANRSFGENMPKRCDHVRDFERSMTKRAVHSSKPRTK